MALGIKAAYLSEMTFLKRFGHTDDFFFLIAMIALIEETKLVMSMRKKKSKELTVSYQGTTPRLEGGVRVWLWWLAICLGCFTVGSHQRL